MTESEHGDGWICKVFLHKKYVYEGTQATAEDGASKGRPLGPWRLQNPEDYLFATAKAKNDVEEILRWAQLATLNPGESYEMYKPGENSTTPNTIQVKFSPNVVRVDVSVEGKLAECPPNYRRYLVQISQTCPFMIYQESSTIRKS